MRLAGAEPVVFASPATGCAPLTALAHRAFCAAAIFRREASETIRVGSLLFRDVPEPLSDSITKIA